MILIPNIKIMDIVQGLNYKSALDFQDDRCIGCGKELGKNNYYILDQSVSPQINKIYCHDCGMEIESKR